LALGGIPVLADFVRRPLPQAIIATLLGSYLSFALRTTRWRLDGAEHLAPCAAGAPVIFAAWHERLPLMPMQWLMLARWGGRAKPACRVHVLISRSRDGRLIARLVRRFGVEVVFGSSSRGGAASTRDLLRLLAGGDQIGITPDGPRGPRRQAADGIALVAALSGVPILPCAAQTTRRWTLRSWDRMVIPRPFGRGIIVCGPPIDVDRRSWRDAMPAIETALTDAADRADRLCGIA
jgi:lysophospholipid acyltransferase (LPLAT)-like uncharacterized protein